jgi:Trp operon repressor
MKGKLQQAAETNAVQTKQLESCATRDELANAIKRSDEMLELMRKRVDEDRAIGEGRYKELYGIINSHGERIGRLEVSQEQLFKMLDKLEVTVTSGFREMKADMKELRDALKRG